MQTTRGNGMPAYRRIQSEIARRIETGELKPGDGVESERALAKLHRVSLMTARHALAALERDGLVERRRGAGTFVARPKIHFNKLMSFTEQMTARGLSAYSRVLSLKMVDTEPEIATKLGLPSGAPLLKIERIREGGAEPFALETCYVSAEEFSGLNRQPLERLSLFSILEREYSIVLAQADEEIDAAAADQHTARLLGISRGLPVLRIRQTIYSTSDKPTVYVIGIYRADRHVLKIRRSR